MEDRIAGMEAALEDLKADVEATITNQREEYHQFLRHCKDWRAEEARSEQNFRATFRQDWPRQPLVFPDLPPSVKTRREDPRPTGSQRTPVQVTGAAAAGAEVSAWVGSSSERRPVQEEAR